MKCISYTALLVVYASLVNCEDVVVNTTHGYVRGTKTDKSVQFLGIPYASAPVRELRWRSPSTARPWSPNVRDATKAAPACPQKYCSKYLPPASCPDIAHTSEDCLHLNVWAPLEATNTSSYPVMVFIHGGAFKWGFGASSVYDGNNLVREGNVVLVNIDYRLGILGFLYTGDNHDDARGNFGIQDQRLALQWVQDNIHNFGGNPNQVTLFGQSAGAQSVAIHMSSPLSNGLFHQAIIESSPFAIPYRTKKTARDLSRVLSHLLRCPDYDLRCLRFRSVDEISEAQERSMLMFSTLTVLDYFEPIGPIIDGDDIKYQPLDAAAIIRVRPMPVMLGTVSEECRLFVYSAWKLNLTKAEYDAALVVFHPTAFESMSREYPVKDDQDLRVQLSQFCTDFMFTCATRNVSNNLIKYGNKNLYRYVFDHASVNHGGWGNLTFCEDHVCHAEELSFVFGNGGGVNTTSAELFLSENMLTYWTNFAYSGNPNDGPRLPKLPWPTYDNEGQPTLHFITPIDNYDNLYRDKYCNYWDNLGYK